MLQGRAEGFADGVDARPWVKARQIVEVGAIARWDCALLVFRFACYALFLFCLDRGETRARWVCAALVHPHARCARLGFCRETCEHVSGKPANGQRRGLKRFLTLLR